MALLNAPLDNPKTRQILFHNHQIKALNSVQFPHFSNTHLSNNHLKNPSLRCFSQKQSQSTQKTLKTEEEELGEKVEKYKFERLFSNLNQATLKHEPGSLSSSIFLVAGTTIGAGILAIPAVTQESGFLASAVACIGCWVYMVTTGLLIAEVNVNTMCELGSGGVSLVSMAKRTVGSVGVQVACWSYIFIHYALLVAYISRSSEILTTYLGIPQWESAALFSLAFGALCYFGSQRFIGAVNGLLVLGITTAFTALVVVASADLHLDALLKANFEAVPSSIPVITLAYVYHNVVPVLCTNLEGDLSKEMLVAFSSSRISGYVVPTVNNPGYDILLRIYPLTAVFIGTAIPLLLFLVWNGVILGTFTNIDSDVGRILDPLQQLRSNNGVVGPIVDTFSIFAIGTSYIGFVLGLADFLADLLKLPAGQSKPLPYLITLLPPLILAQLDPEIFFKALDFAGTYGVLVLFGILPAAMSWSDRYLTSPELPKVPQLVPGGKVTLSLVMGGAAWVISSEILNTFNHS